MGNACCGAPKRPVDQTGAKQPRADDCSEAEKGSSGVLAESKAVEKSLPMAALLTALVLDEVLCDEDIKNHVSDKVCEIVKALAANKIRLEYKIYRRGKTRLVRTVAISLGTVY